MLHHTNNFPELKLKEKHEDGKKQEKKSPKEILSNWLSELSFLPWMKKFRQGLDGL